MFGHVRKSNRRTKTRIRTRTGVGPARGPGRAGAPASAGARDLGQGIVLLTGSKLFSLIFILYSKAASKTVK